MKRALLAAVFLLGCALVARGDHVTMSSGREFDGQVLQESDASITFRLDHGTITVPRSSIVRVQKVAPPPPARPTPSVGVPPTAAPITKPTSQPAQRIQGWEPVTSRLAKQPWATNLLQIPATVIDRGQMRYVPYSSYRCGEDYEVNIYGDPDAPAGVEIGIYRGPLRNDQAKANCIEFIASLLSPADAAKVRSVNRAKDLMTRDGLTIEVTPETAEDAYGGWWVSVYSEKGLDAARATEEEIARITVPKTPKAREPAKPKTAPSVASASLMGSVYDWQDNDVQWSRPSSSSGAAGDGSVYVRGYYRKDGTYVQSYTRSASGSGGGRRR